jgi:hypothetical protein
LHENGENVKMTAEEFVVDTKTAFLEIAESGFRMILPDIEPHRFSWGIEKASLIDVHCLSPKARKSGGIAADAPHSYDRV